MRLAGIEGARRGRRVRTTRPDRGAERPADLVERDFSAEAPDKLWVADLTYVPAWAGVACVCFVVDAFSRVIVGWRVAARMRAQMALDALETARASRGTRLGGLVAHTDAGSQFTSARWAERIGELGAAPSVRTVGDSYDNAPAETVNGLYKTEPVRGPTGGPRRSVGDVEPATLAWVHRHNTQRLHGHLDDIPPAEYEAAHAAQRTDHTLVGNQKTEPPTNPGRFRHRTRVCATLGELHADWTEIRPPTHWTWASRIWGCRSGGASAVLRQRRADRAGGDLCVGVGGGCVWGRRAAAIGRACGGCAGGVRGGLGGFSPRLRAAG